MGKTVDLSTQLDKLAEQGTGDVPVTQRELTALNTWQSAPIPLKTIEYKSDATQWSVLPDWREQEIDRPDERLTLVADHISWSPISETHPLIRLFAASGMTQLRGTIMFYKNGASPVTTDTIRMTIADNFELSNRQFYPTQVTVVIRSGNDDPQVETGLLSMTLSTFTLQFKEQMTFKNPTQITFRVDNIYLPDEPFIFQDWVM